MLIGDDLPELGADLVAALASLDVDDLTPTKRSETEDGRRRGGVRDSHD
jgi:hypothetical protein